MEIMDTESVGEALSQLNHLNGIDESEYQLRLSYGTGRLWRAELVELVDGDSEQICLTPYLSVALAESEEFINKACADIKVFTDAWIRRTS